MNKVDPLTRNRALLFCGLLLAGLLLRAEYLREYSASVLYDLALGADVSEYYNRACEILRGVWFNHIPDIHAPLYSLFLAVELSLADGSIPYVRIFQLGLNVLCSCGFYLFLRDRCRHTDWTPEWMFAGLMLYFPLYFFQAELVSESLLLPLLAGAAMCVMTLDDYDQEDHRAMILAGSGGLLTGLAVITHPMALLYFLAQTFALLVGIRGRRAWVYCGLALLMILPVSVFRSFEAGRPVLVQSNSSFNAYLGNHDGADGTCCIRPGESWKKVHRQARTEALRKKITDDAVYQERIMTFLTEKPLDAGLLFCRKALLVMAPGELPAGADTPGIFRRTVLMHYGAPLETLLVMILGLAGLYAILSDRERRAEWKVVLLIFGSFYAAQILLVTSGRYRAVMLPALFIFAGYFLQWRPKNKLQWILAPVVSCVFVFSAFFAMPAIADDAESRTLLAEALLKKQQPEKAVKLLSSGLDKSCDPARDLCMLAIAEQKTGDLRSAERHLRQAAEAAPKEADALMDLGILYSEQRKLTEAARCFVLALKREPEHPGVLFNYALVLEKQHKYMAAESCLRSALSQEPDNVPALNSMGRICYVLHRYQEAEMYFLRALEWNPKHEGVKHNLAITQDKLRRIQKNKR